MSTRTKRLAFYLLLNVVVSALTTWVVISIMLRSNVIPPGGMTTDSVPQNQPLAAEENSEEAIPLGQLEINSIIGAGDIANERVNIRHIGKDEVSLQGWQLVDEQGNAYSFPALTMFRGGAVTVYTKGGTDSVVDLFWGLETAVYSEGEQVVLMDPEGNPQAIYSVP